MDAETAYLFRHALLRDAAYQLQLPVARASLHALACDILLGLFWPEPDPFELDENGTIQVPPGIPAFSILSELAGHADLAAGTHARFRELRVPLIGHAASAAGRGFDLPEARRLWARLAGLPGVRGELAAYACQRTGAMTEAAAEYPEAAIQLRRAIRLARDNPERSRIKRAVEAASLNLLGRVQSRLGDPDGARRLWQESIGIASEIGHRKGLLVSTANMLFEAGQRRDTDITIDDVKALIGQADQLSEPTLTSQLRLMLAKLLARSGRLAEAEHEIELGMQGARETGDERLECSALLQKYTLLPERKTADLERALGIARRIGDRSSELVCLRNLALVALDEGRHEDALKLSRENIETCREIGDPVGYSHSLHNLSRVLSECGTDAEIISVHEEAIDVARRVSDHDNLIANLCNFGQFHWERGRSAEAERLFLEALDLSQQLGDEFCSGAVSGNLAILHIERGRPRPAETLLAEAIRTASRFRETAMHRLWTRWDAARLAQLGQWDAAHEQWESVSANAGDPRERSSEERAWAAIKAAAAAQAHLLDWPMPPSTS